MKRKLAWLIGVVLVLSFCLAVSGCGEETKEEVITAISDLNLTQKIPAPVTGEIPLYSFSGSEQYSLQITWKDMDGDALTGSEAEFKGGEIYIAAAVVTANKGYTLEGLKTNSFIHSGTTSCSYNIASFTITLVFTQTENPLIVDDFDLTDKITTPEGMVVPARSFNFQQYTLAVTWKETESGRMLGNSEAFECSTLYTALAVISDTAYGWPAVFQFTHEKAESISYNASTKTITVNFIETDPPPPGNVISGPLPGSWEMAIGQRLALELQAGRTYELGIIYKGNSTGSDPGPAAYFVLCQPDLRPQAWDWFTGGTGDYYLPASSSWNEEIITYTPTETDIHYVILLGTTTGGSASDPFSVKEIYLYDITDGPGTVNLVSNGNFAFASAINIESGRRGRARLNESPGWVMWSQWRIDPLDE